MSGRWISCTTNCSTGARSGFSRSWTRSPRLSPAVDVRRSYRGADVVATLEHSIREVGLPKTIRVDNGPEFVSKELDLWAFMRGVTLDFSRPGKPTDNSFIESFNGKFRAECLNANWFLSSTRRVKNARLGVETITTCVRIDRSAIKRRESFIRHPATPASRPADEAGISRPSRSNVGGKFSPQCTNVENGPVAGGDQDAQRAGSGCLNSAPRKLSGFLPGYAERGALRF